MSSTSLAPDESKPPWLELPRDITAMILHKLGAIEILLTAQLVCTTWWSVCQDAAMWRSINIRNESFKWILRYINFEIHLWIMESHLEKMFRQAVDRSRGQLNDIIIEEIGTDDLLLYICERSKQLKRLQLVSCVWITSEGLVEALKQLPLLEELHLYCTSIRIEVVGLCCPYLKTFKLNYRLYRYPHVKCNLEAFAIARNMRELRQLQLFGNNMTSEGLQAILDGCPHLDTLDLRRCCNVDLEGDLGRLCSQRIKELRCPHDPIDDCGFDDFYYEPPLDNALRDYFIDYDTSDDD